MKKILLTLGVLSIMSIPALADGNAFTPLDFNDTQYSSSPAAKATSATPSIISNNGEIDMEAIGNGNIQNAIQQLDNAQIDIRNDLLNLKTKFADVDAQYKLVKAERASLRQQIRTIERRIRDIDNAKEKIRRNML